MALEAAVYPQNLFSYSFKDLYSMGGVWSHDFGLEEDNRDSSLYENWGSSSMVKEQTTNSSPETYTGETNQTEASTTTSGRRKRQRTKRCRNKEEVENQRMTHIAVERNRRKQMNEYLSVLRSLMPAAYAQRGDQASIVGGAINFVKELEQLLQVLEAQKQKKQQSNADVSSLFAEFFTFPLQSTATDQTNESMAEKIEVRMVENHANLKILSKRRPKQLMKMVDWCQSRRLTILHLNVTTADHMVLYSFNVKVEEECQLTTVDEISSAVYEMLGRILEEASLSSES